MSGAQGADGAGLEVRDLGVRLEDTQALAGLSLDLPLGEVLAVLGPSGSGKSTLLRVVAGLQPPSSGSVRWDGTDLAGVPVHRRGFALMFQDGQLFAHRSVGDNVAYALAGRRRRAGASADRDTRVTELLELVGLPGYAGRRPATLSGGEQQRVALARALAARPRLLLLDEPLSSLDAALRTRLAGDLRQILRDAGATAMTVTHDHAEAFALADRVALLRAGELVQHGVPGEVWGNPATAEVASFLGYERVLEGAAAAGLREVGGAAQDPRPVAVRPGVLQLADAGTSAACAGTAPTGAGGRRVDGVVGALRRAPEQVLVDVEVEGWGTLPGHAAPTADPRVGDRVRWRVDLTRTAPVGPDTRGDRQDAPDGVTNS